LLPDQEAPQGEDRMINGLYSATSGMFNQIQRSDTIANNIANVETAGYKSVKNTFGQLLSQAVFRDSALEPSGPQVASFQGGGSYIASVHTNNMQGPIRQTWSDYDLALSGPGYFVVQAPSGDMYTRNGNFHVNEKRELVTGEGLRVLGTNGPIILPEGFFDISQEGVINMGKPGEQTLRIVEFDNPDNLRRVGHNLYSMPDEAKEFEKRARNARVEQGFLEASNVQIVREMVDLIDASRQYEANQKVIQSLDQTLERAVNDVGRVG